MKNWEIQIQMEKLEIGEYLPYSNSEGWTFETVTIAPSSIADTLHTGEYILTMVEHWRVLSTMNSRTDSSASWSGDSGFGPKNFQ